ncbi:MAG: phosphate ABC transporter permease subunit PstC [Treponema sp.]|nr:phosphate ABC transporter permease subunit PstC [Treponema sp.]
MSIISRKQTDLFARYLFTLVSLVLVLALASILFFVFAQGTAPFFTSTSKGIQLVVQNISEIEINNVTYKDRSTYIELDPGTTNISLDFLKDGEKITADIDTVAGEKDPQKMLDVKLSAAGNGSVSFPEAYVYTITWPANIKALDQRVHIIMPEPPYSFIDFITGLKWSPSRDKIYGILPMIIGTILAALGAVLLGVPAALLCAVFMSEFLPQKIAVLARSGIELLAGIPSVVYGFFGLMVIVPAVRNIFNIPSGNTLLSAVIILALMILPTVITIAETSLRAVPLANREASLSLGASKMQTCWRVVLPHAGSGVIAGIILGISRAVGETMAVILVAGNSPQIAGPLQGVRTMTATIAMEMGYASGRHSEMLFSIGVALFIMILILNSLILWIRKNPGAA